MIESVKKFSYEVIHRYPEIGQMEVEYYAEGFNPILVAMPMPAEGVDKVAYFTQHAPHVIWDNVIRSRMPMQEVLPGERGVVEIDTLPMQSELPPILPGFTVNRIEL